MSKLSAVVSNRCWFMPNLGISKILISLRDIKILLFEMLRVFTRRKIKRPLTFYLFLGRTLGIFYTNESYITSLQYNYISFSLHLDVMSFT